MSLVAASIAAIFTLLLPALAFSPDQCNVTSYGAPTKAACNTLLTEISAIGAANVSYLFIPAKFATPVGLSNVTRKDFPQSWSTTGCKAALVPIEVTTTSVTSDTSTYQDLAAAGQVVVQECVSNATKSSGGWELAGDNEELVLHIYAAGSEIDSTISKQTSTEIAATSEDQVDQAEEDDPDYSDFIDGDDDDDDAGDDIGDGSGDDGEDSSGVPVGGSGSGSVSTKILTTSALPKVTTQALSSAPLAPPAPLASSAPLASATAVASAGTFKYLGCSMDNSAARTLSSLSWAGTGLSVERCASYCAAYVYMGVEFGSECYCGGDSNGKGVKSATIHTSGPNDCTMPCNGNATELCGGSGWMNFYQSAATVNTEATS